MPRKSQINLRRSTISSSSREVLGVAALAFAVSLISLSYYFQRSEILLYGDAIAHINIARRVFDSLTPGLLQLGTVWLPLPHLLMVPFLFSNAMWQTGIGGSIPSMLAYVLGVVGIFRLTRGFVNMGGLNRPLAGVGPWLAALVYAANPNLIYLQTTAMTETVYLAFFVWAVVYLVEFMRAARQERLATKDAKVHNGTSLWKCALCVAGAELTRYDGWMLATVMGIAIAILAVRRWQDERFRRTALKFLVIIAAPPALWLAYNGAVYGNPLGFANGPYSARAIEQRTATPGMPSHPGAGNIISAAQYFLKAAELNMASGNWGRIWIAIALAGLAMAMRRIRVSWPVLILWLPLLFYAFSIAHGGVPLFMPAWWPFTFYNVRYGIQLLPLFAVSAGLMVTGVSTVPAPEGAIESDSATRSLKRLPDASRFRLRFHEYISTQNLQITVLCALLLIAILSYISVWKTQPVCFTEAWVNSRTKLTLESAVARTMSGLPRTSEYLMYLGDHVGAFEQAGIPVRQVINEGNHRPWKRPSDPEGLWERTLADPSRYADIVIAFDGDPVDRAVDKSKLTLISVIHTTGQPEARIYAARSSLNQSR